MVIEDALGAEPLAFAVRQALVTAGFRVGSPDGAPAAGASPEGSVTLHFERAARDGDDWRVWTRTERASPAGSAAVVTNAWLVGCVSSGCSVTDSADA